MTTVKLTYKKHKPKHECVRRQLGWNLRRLLSGDVWYSEGENSQQHDDDLVRIPCREAQQVFCEAADRLHQKRVPPDAGRGDGDTPFHQPLRAWQHPEELGHDHV